MEKQELDHWGKIQCWSWILDYESRKLKDYSKEFKLKSYDGKVAIGITYSPV